MIKICSMSFLLGIKKLCKVLEQKKTPWGAFKNVLQDLIKSNRNKTNLMPSFYISNNRMRQQIFFEPALLNMNMFCCLA